MSTFKMMKWAWDLIEIDPVERLVALYFAGSAGAVDEQGSGAMDINILEMARWCGCSKEDAVLALDRLNRFGLRAEELGPWLYRAWLPLAPMPKPANVALPPERMMHLYVVSTPGGVKIGVASNIESRISSLRSGSPHNLTVHFVGRAPERIVKWAEARCHGDLRPHHLKGEWFSCDPEIAASVARAVLAEGGAPQPQPNKDAPP
jgi:hypothetical protein